MEPLHDPPEGHLVVLARLLGKAEEQEEEEKDELESEEDDNNADVDIESEDSSTDREAAALQSSRLTQRQAALQGGLEVSHVELGMHNQVTLPLSILTRIRRGRC